MMRFFLLSLTFLTFFMPAAQARIDLLPHLLLIEGRERSAELTVLNLSEGTHQYKIKYIHYRQDEKGLYTILEEPLSPLFDPDEVVRLSPREFLLKPRGKQKVRFALRKPADLPEGEYRFHIVATSYEAKEGEQGDQDVSVSLKINLGIAIPVIVRHGDLSAAGKLQDFKLLGSSETESGQPELAFKATREGDASTLGRVDVFWAPEGEDFEQIGFVTNFNLFTEINERIGSVPLEKAPIGGGTIRVLYTDYETKEVYDEIIFDL